MIMVKRVAMLALLLGLGSIAQAQGDPMLVNGAGATFPYPIYSKWFDEYHKLHPNIQINYQSIGSGGGIRQLLAGTVDFGASDGPMSDEQLGQAKVKVLHFPTVLGADVRSEEHTSELQSPCNLVCRLLLEKKKKNLRRTNVVA